MTNYAYRNNRVDTKEIENIRIRLGENINANRLCTLNLTGSS